MSVAQALRIRRDIFFFGYAATGQKKPQLQGSFAAALFFEVPGSELSINHPEKSGPEIFQLPRSTTGMRVKPVSAMRYTTTRKGSSEYTSDVFVRATSLNVRSQCCVALLIDAVANIFSRQHAR